MFKANSRSLDGKSTKLEQWKAIERITGSAPEPLRNMPKLQSWNVPLWEAYNTMIQGLEVLTLRDIKAYSDLYDEPFERWEIDALLGIDLARQEEWQTKSKP